MWVWIALVFCTVLCISPQTVSTETAKVGQPLYCHGCVAVLKELHKVLKDSSGRKRAVERSLTSLCNLNNFVSYTFSPPKMIKACNYIVDTHRGQLEEHLIQFYKKYKTEDNLPLQEKLCDSVLRACDGIRRPTTDSEMKPHGLSVDDANKKIQNEADGGFQNSESDARLQLEKPNVAGTTPLPREEL